jgi:hypothetical protein
MKLVNQSIILFVILTFMTSCSLVKPVKVNGLESTSKTIVVDVLLTQSGYYVALSCEINKGTHEDIYFLYLYYPLKKSEDLLPNIKLVLDDKVSDLLIVEEYAGVKPTGLFKSKIEKSLYQTIANAKNIEIQANLNLDVLKEKVIPISFEVKTTKEVFAQFQKEIDANKLK